MLRALVVSAFALALPGAAFAQEISISDGSANEGNVGTTAMTFNVTLSAPSGGTVTVDYNTQDNGSAAAQQDYDIKSGTVTFAPGETSKTILIDVRGDTADEPDETFDLKLHNPSGATLADNKAVGIIRDDDAAPAPDAVASINDISVTEGDSGTTKGTFTVSLDRPAGRTLQYDVTTTNGETNGERSAIPQIDFYSNHEVVTFQPGEQTKSFSVDVLGDTIDEDNEFVIVRLTLHGYEPGQIADGEGILTILDDDPKAAAVAGVSAASRVCLSRRNFTIRLRDHLFAKRRDVLRAIVFVDGRRVRTRFGNRITSFVDLRRKPKKTVNVDVSLVLRDGTVIKRQRRYRLCDPRKLDDGIPPAL